MRLSERRQFWKTPAALGRLLGVLLPVDVFPSAPVSAKWKGGNWGLMDISWEIMDDGPKPSPNLKWIVEFHLIACDEGIFLWRLRKMQVELNFISPLASNS